MPSETEDLVRATLPEETGMLIVEEVDTSLNTRY